MNYIYCKNILQYTTENTLTPNATSFGYIKDNELLVPERVQILIPPINELVPNCTCTTCARKTCICRQSKIPCCSFCYCTKKQNDCKNIEFS